MFKGRPDGLMEYEWKGETKVAYLGHNEKWGVHLAVGMNRKDIVAGLDVK